MTISARIFVVLVFCVLLTPVASSQDRLRGVVTDSEGAIISGAHIVIHWDASGSKVGLTTNIGIAEDRTLISDAKGLFSADLPPGFYDVFVSATAFSPDCRKIRITKDNTGVYNPRLKVSALVIKEFGDKFYSMPK
jgi:hypothetical protein